MADVSVIMSVYQEKQKNLSQAIESILAQTQTNLEFLIYLDGTQEVAEELVRAYARRDARIHILGEEQNRGLSHGLNACIERAGGKYLARMDSDDIAEPNRLKRQTEFLDHHPNCDFVGCSTFLFDEQGIYGARTMKAKPQKEDFYEYLPFIHPSVVFRREVFDAGARYPESSKTIRCEDLALFMELYAGGRRGENLQEFLYRYREDKDAFAKKKYRYRLTESRVRREGYDHLQLRGAKSWIYTVKPLAVGLIPGPLMMAIKRQKNGRDMGHETTYSNV